ncbi:NAD(P)/FAD-dependent oxidoreductase [Gulosibacter sediminis]|uniref:NAD(P)/FAD-dependent oxidoreductase n=1 Tax=Gulosibacter sediminis TaxID=1729695 RepID=UPI0024ADF421|nr:FAD-dependent oxidoreductase [Gulosibacter sediminis]
MRVVIVGAGHAGVQAAETLRDEGFDGDVVLLDRDTRLPYQRPPLSKDGLASGDEPLPLRGAEFYERLGIELRLGVELRGIDPGARAIELADARGERSHITYDELVLAVGTPARRLRCAEGESARAHVLRTADDAEALRGRLAEAERVVVVGSGFIGLEFAAVAATKGKRVTLLSRGSRVLGRSASATTADWLTAHLRAAGVEFVFGVDDLADERDLADWPADLTVAGIGVDDCPMFTGAARSADIAVDRGVIVDASLRTSLPGIWAIGDIARFPDARGELQRIESVQNATEQGRHVARAIVHGASDYDEVPWFWSIQAGAKLQITGLADGADAEVVLGDLAAGKFSVLRFAGERLVCVESVNKPADHVAARKLLASAAAASVSPAAAAEAGFTLKSALVPA